MIEVLFGESEAASMKAAKSKLVSVISDGPTAYFFAGKKKPPAKESAGWVEGTSDEVICLALMLDIGELSEDICTEYRRKLIGSLYDQKQWKTDSDISTELNKAFDMYVMELDRLKSFLEDGEDIRIWYSKSAYSLCGLYFICGLLSRYKNNVFAVELPEYRVSGNRITTYQNWGEISAEEFSLFLDKQKELSVYGIKRYHQLWTELLEDNSPLRAVINNKVVGVKEDFYDFLIWKRLTDKPVKEARLIGDILGHYQLSVGDWWYAKRIQHFIDKKDIMIIEDSESRYARIIKKV